MQQFRESFTFSDINVNRRLICHTSIMFIFSKLFQSWHSTFLIHHHTSPGARQARGKDNKDLIFCCCFSRTDRQWELSWWWRDLRDCSVYCWGSTLLVPGVCQTQPPAHRTFCWLASTGAERRVSEHFRSGLNKIKIIWFLVAAERKFLPSWSCWMMCRGGGWTVESIMLSPSWG